MNKKNVIQILLSSVVGSVFLFSAIAKLIHIDNFEIYVYSFNILSYDLTALFSRGLIFFEMIMGLFIILKVQYRITWFATLAMLVGFTIFLGGLAISGNQDNCQCFGSIVELDPVSSIIKNLILIGLLFMVKNPSPLSFKYKKCISIALAVIAFVVSFIVIPPDFLYNKFAPHQLQTDEVAFTELKNDSTIQTLSIHEGKKIVAFYISGCQFCKLGMQKMDAIFMNNDIDKSKLNIIIAGEPGKAIENFRAATEIDGYPITQVTKELIPSFMKTIQGSFPTFLFVEDGEIIKNVDFRGINDKEITTFLQ